MTEMRLWREVLASQLPVKGCQGTEEGQRFVGGSVSQRVISKKGCLVPQPCLGKLAVQNLSLLALDHDSGQNQSPLKVFKTPLRRQLRSPLCRDPDPTLEEVPVAVRLTYT